MGSEKEPQETWRARQEKAVGRGLGTCPTLSWKVDILGSGDLESYWVWVSEEGGKESKARRRGNREGGIGHALCVPPPPPRPYRFPAHPPSEIQFLLENSEPGFPRKTSWISVADTRSSLLCIPSPLPASVRLGHSGFGV